VADAKASVTCVSVLLARPRSDQTLEDADYQVLKSLVGDREYLNMGEGLIPFLDAIGNAKAPPAVGKPPAKGNAAQA
jgi:hypothetical protein